MSPKAPKKTFSDLKAAAQKGLSNIDVDALKDKAAVATSTLACSRNPSQSIMTPTPS